MKKVYIAAAAVLIISAAIIFIFPFEVPYTISAPGKIVPAKEWIIMKNDNGQLISYLRNNRTGAGQDYTISQVERGDAVKFSIRSGVYPGAAVAENDTVASLYSNEIQFRVSELQGELSSSIAELQSLLTGEKDPLVREAEEQLSYYKKQFEHQNSLAKRYRQMFDKQLISQDEYEITQSLADLNRINISMAEARIEALATGEKPEAIQIIRNQISSLEDRINLLNRRLSAFNLVSPIKGITTQMNVGDTVLIVADNSDFLLLMPVDYRHGEFLKEGSEVTFKSPYFSDAARGTLIRVEPFIQYMTGSQVLMTAASLKTDRTDLPAGLIVDCEIQGGRMPLLQYLESFFTSYTVR